MKTNRKSTGSGSGVMILTHQVEPLPLRPDCIQLFVEGTKRAVLCTVFQLKTLIQYSNSVASYKYHDKLFDHLSLVLFIGVCKVVFLLLCIGKSTSGVRLMGGCGETGSESHCLEVPPPFHTHPPSFLLFLLLPVCFC